VDPRADKEFTEQFIKFIVYVLTAVIILMVVLQALRTAITG